MRNPAHTRDYRIDLMRGLALMMIYINHIPGTFWENFTSRNFGFSDAAEGFVLMSGIATGLAYGPAFLAQNPTLSGALRPWRRALTLWGVHVLITGFILLLFYISRAEPGILGMAKDRNILPALAEPLRFALPLSTLGHQFAYADILPLYVVLMLAAPALLFLAVRWPRLVMAGSLLLWCAVGIFKIRVPTWPLDNGWFFNPLSWQVLFVGGILTGLAMRQGRRFLSVRVWPLRLAIAFILVAAIWVQVPKVAAIGGHGLWILHEYAGFPPIFTSFDKSYVFLPRLLHILALAYVVSALPVVKTLAGSRFLSPVVMLGRHSLPVFATSTVLAYAGQVIKKINPASGLLDTALIVSGMAILFLVAAYYDGKKRKAPPVSRRAGEEMLSASKAAA